MIYLMTELMKLLYNYTMDFGYSARLNTPEYRALEDREDRLARQLRRELPTGAGDTLERYQDAITDRQGLELEAMFLSVFSLAKELG